MTSSFPTPMKSSEFFAVQNTFEVPWGERINIQNVVCWNHKGKLLFALDLEKNSYHRYTEIRNDKWEVLCTLDGHWPLTIWNNFLVASNRTKDEQYHFHYQLCLCNFDDLDKKFESNNSDEDFHHSDHNTNLKLRCLWSRKYEAEFACVWNDKLCVSRCDERRVKSLVITYPDGRMITMPQHTKTSAMGVVGDQLWIAQGMDCIFVYDETMLNLNKFRMKIPFEHSAAIACIHGFNKWAILGTNGGYILLYNKFTGEQPKKNWGINVGLGRVSLGVWNKRLVVASGSVISFYNDKMELEDQITDIHNAITQLTVIDDAIYAASKERLFVFKVKLEWKVHRLLWIAFYKNQENPTCYVARLPKEIIKVIAQVLRSC